VARLLKQFLFCYFQQQKVMFTLSLYDFFLFAIFIVNWTKNWQQIGDKTIYVSLKTTRVNFRKFGLLVLWTNLIIVENFVKQWIAFCMSLIKFALGAMFHKSPIVGTKIRISLRLETLVIPYVICSKIWSRLKDWTQLFWESLEKFVIWKL
jgi:hypothetical protein